MNTTSSNPRAGFRATLALAILAALSATHGVSAAPSFGTLSEPTRLASGDVVLGPLPMATPIHVVLGLKLRNRSALEAFVKEGTDAVAAGYLPHLMSNDEAQAQHAPTQAQAQTVANYLVAHGFQNVVVSPSRLLVSADGTAQTASEAFMTSLGQVRTADGRFARANTDAVRIPSALGGLVDSVLGLQTVHVPHTFAVQAGSGGVHTMDAVGHSPVDFVTIYEANGLAAATSVPVGIITAGALGQVKTDLNLFTAANGLPTVVTQTMDTNGTSGNTGHIKDWDLAAQDIVGMAGGVQKLVFYNVPDLSNASLTADYDTIVNEDAVKIIEASVGACETDAASGTGDGSAVTDDALFKLAAAQGQTFVVPTGNSGADACGNGTNTPNYPASSPWVVAVAGSRLNTSGATETTWVSESAWTYSGGSPSTFEPAPSWQSRAEGFTGTQRGPDVALDADPATGSKNYVKGAPGQYGGTGLSAALFAGGWARALQLDPNAGFAAPILYYYYRNFGSGGREISSGNNSGGESGVGYNAGSNYDFATGLGSLDVANLVSSTRVISQWITNPGFEITTNQAWTLSSSKILVNNPKGAHAGNYYISMGLNAGKDVKLTQLVKKTTAQLESLRFWLKIVTKDTGTTAHDILKVEMVNSQGTTVLGTFSNLDATSGYVQRGFDWTPYAGDTGDHIRFEAINDSTLPTTFCLDDVTLSMVPE